MQSLNLGIRFIDDAIKMNPLATVPLSQRLV
jgi:hypothetical protein